MVWKNRNNWGWGRLHQGDLFKNVEIIIHPKRGETITLPYAIVLTQECDLEWDWDSRMGNKGNHKIISILFCPAFEISQVTTGKHFEELGWEMTTEWTTSEIKRLKSNQSARYHNIIGDTTKGIPELVFDFKHYFTLPQSWAYDLLNSTEDAGRFASLDKMYRENLSDRFAHFLQRIA